MNQPKRILRELIALLFRLCAGPWLVRRFVAGRGATIVVYHDPKPETFEKHLRYLAARYAFISLEQLVDAIHAGARSAIPQNALVVTLDDGHRGNYRLLEILERYGCRATVYACSHVVNTRRRFWFAAGHPDVERLKRLPHGEMLAALQKDVGFHPEEESAERQALDLDEMQRMETGVSFGSHTRFHALLVNCSEEESREDLAQSKRRLEEMLGRSVVDFAYTNGDYRDREAKLAARCGYRSARTLDVGWNDVGADPFRLKAMPLQDDASVNVLAAQVCGLFGYLHNLLCGRPGGRHSVVAVSGEDDRQGPAGSGREPSGRSVHGAPGGGCCGRCYGETLVSNHGDR